MAYGQRLGAIASSLALLTGMLLAGAAASAQDLPPGVTFAATDAFEAPVGLGEFQVMTFVIDIAAGAAFPLHSHPGPSKVMILQGELTEEVPGGEQTVYHVGDSFMEEPNHVHAARNTGSDSVRLVWTLLLPAGTDPIIHVN